jgi:hypothetical protein
MNPSDLLTSSEKFRFEQIKSALLAYHESEVLGARASAYRTLTVLVPGIEQPEIEEYWGSESEDDWALRRAIEPVEAPKSEVDQKKLIEYLLSLRRDHEVVGLLVLIYRHADGFERLYGSPSGMFLELILNDAFNSYDDVVLALKRSGPIRL